MIAENISDATYVLELPDCRSFFFSHTRMQLPSSRVYLANTYRLFTDFRSFCSQQDNLVEFSIPSQLARFF